jgi:hypothetical protein
VGIEWKVHLCISTDLLERRLNYERLSMVRRYGLKGYNHANASKAVRKDSVITVPDSDTVLDSGYVAYVAYI